jgi:hypothetical protein
MTELQIYLIGQLDLWRMAFGVIGVIMVEVVLLGMTNDRLSWQGWLFAGIATLLLALAVFLPSSDTVAKIYAHRNHAQQESKP